MPTLFAFPSKNQLNAQGAVTENPGTANRAEIQLGILQISFAKLKKYLDLDGWIYTQTYSNIYTQTCACILFRQAILLAWDLYGVCD